MSFSKSNLDIYICLWSKICDFQSIHLYLYFLSKKTIHVAYILLYLIIYIHVFIYRPFYFLPNWAPKAEIKFGYLYLFCGAKSVATFNLFIYIYIFFPRKNHAAYILLYLIIYIHVFIYRPFYFLPNGHQRQKL